MRGAAKERRSASIRRLRCAAYSARTGSGLQAGLSEAKPSADGAGRWPDFPCDRLAIDNRTEQNSNTYVMHGATVKSAAIPAVRVPPDLREAAESLLRPGETLSGFIEEAVRRNVEFRQAQNAFIARGLASAEAARASGKYVPSAAVLGKVRRRLEKARRSGRQGE